MKEATSRNKKATSCDVNLDLNDDKMNTIRRKFTFASENLQRLYLIFRTKILIKSSFKRLKNSR